jgi:hypothetical protein
VFDCTLLVAVWLTIRRPLAVVVARKTTSVVVELHDTVLSWAVSVNGTSVATKYVAFWAHAAAANTIDGPSSGATYCGKSG